MLALAVLAGGAALPAPRFEDMAVQVGLLGHDGRDRIMGRGQDGARCVAVSGWV